jgi:hypothetical protein
MNGHALLTLLPAFAASPDGGGSPGTPPWVKILVGLAIGIGVGMVIVARAKRKHPLPGPGGPGRKPGERRGDGAEKSDRG